MRFYAKAFIAPDGPPYFKFMNHLICGSSSPKSCPPMLFMKFVCASTAFFAAFTATDLPGILPITAGPSTLLPPPPLTTTVLLAAVPKPEAAF